MNEIKRPLPPGHEKASIFYSDEDNCECGWELPGHVIAETTEVLLVICPNCSKDHEYEEE